MRELIDIVNAFEKLAQSGGRSALATVVNVSGSTYRRPGARMFFSEQGRLAGLINAACLESDLSERAKQVIAAGKPEIMTYDTTSPTDIILGLGLGCNGIVKILIEPSQSKSLVQKVAFLRRCTTAETGSVLATVFETQGTTSVVPGDYVSIDNRGTMNTTILGSSLTAAMQSDSVKALKQQSSTEKEYSVAGGRFKVFIEFIKPPIPLLVFGAGPDAQPLVETAKRLGWRVTVIDHRPAMATKENAPNADAVLLSSPEELTSHLKLAEEQIAVVMTHNFEKDLRLVRILLESSVRYVGLLGPRTKLDTILQNLESEGFKPTTEQLKRLHGPIGLDIGAETPEEIALSIVSEIKAVIEGREGGFLKNRQGAIH